MYYEGDSVQIPANYGCYSLSQFQPDLTDKVSSIQIPDGVRCYLTHWECESIMVDQDTKIVDAPGLSSLYNINFNDQLEKIACYNTNDPQDGF
ncbi:hypothetical protein ASPTUDRAFT_735342 [Aspergillus tubingensis CBS 134.48]|uniref:Uncharacterized protein n=1 Tax=Aspergillus tubingensis (strain CBS 134.48) TaxID=767770 RepID=A0A1L9MXQ9_ASPTC|nr:hypothetical protein ASPTUDRAFT_735342 [Aspergillus tubingensis CBS 134.48]